MEDNKIIIDTRYKLSFLVRLSIILLVSSLTSGFVFYNFVSYDVGQTYTNTRFIIKSVNDFLFPSLWFSVTILTLLLSLGTIIVSIFVSHKIAGPIYRLEITLKDFKVGKFYTIFLRTNDQTKVFMKKLNEFVQSLIANFTLVKKNVLNLKGLIEEEKQECNNEEINYHKMITLNKQLKAEIKSLQDIMTRYITD